jgi:hypothetical protein
MGWKRVLDGERVNARRIFVGRRLRKWQLGKSRRLEDNINIDLREICCKGGR